MGESHGQFVRNETENWTMSDERSWFGARARL